jgi:hypothetical protein
MSSGPYVYALVPFLSCIHANNNYDMTGVCEILTDIGD